ncbi:MAG: universal stress protein [Hyphomicrobiales bacterium]|nr:MAG: universal stress protein [Hyphomicrobiales bacterium]
MSYKDILVYLDDSESCRGRIETALKLAEAHQAHLVGLALAVEPTIPAYIGAELPVEVRDIQRKAAIDRAKAQTEMFEQLAGKEGVSSESRIVNCYESTAGDTLSFHARHADLVVMGQADPDSHFATLTSSMAEEVLFSSGRPIYLVPYIGMKNSITGKAIIAWDGGRESTRAVHDALPILAGMDEVVVLVVDAGRHARAHGAEPGADLATHIARHGINVRVDRVQSAGIDIAEVILNAIAENGANLLIMGGYGHSRLREMTLGGVTHTILKEMTAPVLMSH